MPERVVATKEMIERLFDGAAPSYDRTGPGVFKAFGARLAELLPLRPGARMLDVATGTAAALLPAARRVGPEGQAMGVDLSSGILAEAQRAAQAEGLTNITLRRMDAEHLDLPDQAFDVVTCAFALFLFPDVEAALREMYRVCRPGGHVGVSLFGKPPAPFDPGWPILFQQLKAYEATVRMPQAVALTPGELEALLTRAGFQALVLHSDAHDIVYENAEDWWAFQLTVGPRVSILGLDDQTRARFKEEYLAKLRPLFRPDGLHLAVMALYALGQR